MGNYSKISMCRLVWPAIMGNSLPVRLSHVHIISLKVKYIVGETKP